MPLKMYRRHNPANCAADKDSEHCYTMRAGKILPNTRKPRPVWVRGTTANEHYIRQPLNTPDWTRGIDLARGLETTGTIPQAPKKLLVAQRLRLGKANSSKARSHQTSSSALYRDARPKVLRVFFSSVCV